MTDIDPDLLERFVATGDGEALAAILGGALYNCDRVDLALSSSDGSDVAVYRWQRSGRTGRPVTTDPRLLVGDNRTVADRIAATGAASLGTPGVGLREIVQRLPHEIDVCPSHGCATCDGPNDAVRRRTTDVG